MYCLPRVQGNSGRSTAGGVGGVKTFIMYKFMLSYDNMVG